MEESRSSHAVVRFACFELDQQAGELRKEGECIRLQDQPFQILRILLERPGEIITRDELRHKIWPADTFVDFDHGINNAIKRLREALGDTAETPRYIETLPRRGYRFVGKTEVATPAALNRIQSLAVLPLENLSRDADQEFFADGMTEALITNLAKISAWHVVSRTSAMHYKGVHRPLREIARELQVDGIVEGTVMRAGPRVRISAQLIDARFDAHLWAETYDRDLRDVLELQSEVARSIAREVQVKVSPEERIELDRARSIDPEAYEAYLKGRHHWNKRTSGDLNKAIDYFQHAIEKEPNYAAAHTGLADCAGRAGFWSFASPTEGCGKAKSAALKSLKIEETAEARTSLGWAIMHYDWDLCSAEREFQLAVQENPLYATAHQSYGHCLGVMGRFEEAFAELKHAIQLEPLSLIIGTSYAGISWLGRRWDQAIEQTEKTLDLDPNFAAGLWGRARCYIGKGMVDTAITYAQEAVKLSFGTQLFFIADLGYAYARAGRTGDAEQILHQLQELGRRRYVDSCLIAQIYVALGEVDEAFRWLERAFQERAAWVVYLATDPWFDPLRSDRRFDQLLQRLNYPSHRI